MVVGSVTEESSTAQSAIESSAIESQTRTIADLVEETGFLRNQTRLLVKDSSEVHRDSSRVHTDALRHLLASRTGERSRQQLDDLLGILNGEGFAWRDLSRLIGVSVPAIRKWRRGEAATGENRRRVAELVAFCDIVRRRDLISDVAGWLEVPLVDGAPVTGLDLLAANRFDLLFRWAGDTDVDPELIMDEYEPGWRSKYASEFEVFVDVDGQKSLRYKTPE